MSDLTPGKLSLWTDADELIEMLGQISVEDRADLEGAVERLLDHDDAEVRQEALRVLGVLWKSQHVHGRVMDKMLSDDDPEVRAAASYAVAATSSKESLAADIQALLKVVEDEKQPPFVRGTAYDALLILHRRNAFPTKQREFEPEADIDWEWLRTVKHASSEEKRT